MSRPDMAHEFNLKYSLRLAFLYVLAKLKFIHSLLPNKLKEELPTGWNNKMFWTAFLSGGARLYYDYYCKFKQPKDYRPKVSVKPQFRLSEQDIQFFHENGYLGPFDLISPDEAEEMRQYLLDSVVSTKSSQSQNYQIKQGGYVAQSLLPKTASLQSENLKKFKLRRFDTFVNRHLDDSRLLSLLSSPGVVERCAQILGPDLLLWRSGFFQVAPHGQGTQLHQNSTWLYQNARDSVVNPPNFDELFQITCWIALTDAREENGGMVVLPGTHNEIYPLKERKKQANESKNVHVYGNSYFRDLDYPIDSAKKVHLNMKPGQFFIFCERMIHGSTDNTTDAERWALSYRLVRTDTRIFTKEMLEKGHQCTYHNIKNYTLDHWSAVLVRGEDHFGYNRFLKHQKKT